jgi:hypothetical protein
MKSPQPLPPQLSRAPGHSPNLSREVARLSSAVDNLEITTRENTQAQLQNRVMLQQQVSALDEQVSASRETTRVLQAHGRTLERLVAIEEAKLAMAQGSKDGAGRGYRK